MIANLGGDGKQDLAISVGPTLMAILINTTTCGGNGTSNGGGIANAAGMLHARRCHDRREQRQR